MLTLASIFTIAIAAYAVRSDHYHVVLHLNNGQAVNWSESEVIELWRQIFKGNLLSQRYSYGKGI